MTGKANASMTTMVSPSNLPCINPMISYCPPERACITCRASERAGSEGCGREGAGGRRRRGTDHLDEGYSRDSHFFKVVRILSPWSLVQDCLLLRFVVTEHFVDLYEHERSVVSTARVWREEGGVKAYFFDVVVEHESSLSLLSC